MNEGALPELPGGWLWTRLGDIADRINPGFPSGKHNKESHGVPHLRPMNINIKGEIELSEVKYVQPDSYDSLLKGDVLFNNTNSPELLGKTSYIKNDTNWAYSNHMTRIRLNSSFLNSAWISYYLHSLFLKGFFKMSCTHHVNQASINSTFLSQKVPIPLSPLPEQRAIVSKIEQLFSDLDNGIKNFKKAQAQLKRYRKVVLNIASEGQLTAKWREKHQNIESAENRWKLPIPPVQSDELPKIPSSWIYRHLEDIAKMVSVGYVGPTSQYYCDESSGVLFLRSQNVRPGRLDFTEVRYVTHEFHVKAKKSQLQPGDLLIVRVGANRGDSCIVPNFVTELNCANIIFAEPYEGISEYLNLYFQTENCRKLMLAMTTGSAQGVINTKSVAKVPIPIPPLAEQRRIVTEVERRLSISDKMEATIAESLEKAESLRQSILKKAFEGKLLNQKELEKARNASDWEPAEKLLERIKAEKKN